MLAVDIQNSWHPNSLKARVRKFNGTTIKVQNCFCCTHNYAILCRECERKECEREGKSMCRLALQQFFLYIFVTHSVRWPNFGQNKSKHFDIVLIKWPISLHYYWPAAHFIHFSSKIEKKPKNFRGNLFDLALSWSFLFNLWTISVISN